ncbi:MAG: haloacid dehalogenase [Desulfitibacter sp. BRH_c19]|nr:MAG: haloacid dehalogenase [Desulfitibacter sp. BRH_c19]
MVKSGLIMFDYDGVIVDSFEVHARNFIVACQENEFNEVNNYKDLLDLYEGNIYSGLSAKGLTKSTIDQILKDYAIKQKTSLQGVRLFQGMKECIEILAKSNEIYIITSNVSDAVVDVLERLKVRGFQDVIGAEKEKSKVKKIKTLKSKYSNLASFYVGDTKGDIFEGKEAGVKTIGVSWGWHGKARLMEAVPDYIVEYPEELVNLLSN